MKETLNQLIYDAIKYTQNKPIITILTENKNVKIIISVSDNGVGMDKLEQDKVFNFME